MERGPLALFGAIIAVGLGPALWMGVQLGPTPHQGPATPPVVNQQGAERAGQELLGGTGAGEATNDAGLDAEPRGRVTPLTSSPTAKPVARTSATPALTSSPTPEPTRTATQPAETTDPTSPAGPDTTSPSPAETTSGPATDPTETTAPPIEDETGYPSEDVPSDEDPAPYGDSDARQADGVR